jgi:peptide-methionine (S)-S-oxide reductase
MSLILSLILSFNMSNQIIENQKEIYLGGGCFWCVEAVFEELIGVTNVQSGFSGGTIKNPSYVEVSRSKTNHAEVCKIVYDPNKVSLKVLLEVFFLSHDPTTLNRQGNDIGAHYRSIILFNNLEEKKIIDKFINKVNIELFDNKIVTEVKEFTAFYDAENYHQNYFKQNQDQPYCQFVISPKVSKARNKLSKYYIK